MVTVSYEDLYDRLGRAGRSPFAGSVTAASIRKIACDADIIPVVLAANGRILDRGRSERYFPAPLRQALIARDRGCAFPCCTMPATWTEAHHITWWENGGRTCTDDGCMLCVFHHHLMHQGDWQIIVRDGDSLVHPAAHRRSGPGAVPQSLLAPRDRSAPAAEHGGASVVGLPGRKPQQASRTR
jgi:hypothetical protein